MARFPLCSFLLTAFAIAGTLGQDADLTTTYVDKLSIAQLVDDTVASARNGVGNIALRNSLESIEDLAESYLDERNAIVDGQNLIDLLDDITTQDDWQITLSALLEDPLVQEERKVTAGLFVLNVLSLRIRAEDNDTQVNVLVAAVRFTAKSVGTSVSIGDTLYNYKENIGKQVKRWISFDYEYPGYYDYPGFYESKYRHYMDSRNLKRKRWSASGSASGGSGSSSSSSSSSSGRDVRSNSEIQDEQQMDSRNLIRKRWSASGSASGGSGGSSSSSSSSSGRDVRSGSARRASWGIGSSSGTGGGSGHGWNSGK